MAAISGDSPETTTTSEDLEGAQPIDPPVPEATSDTGPKPEAIEPDETPTTTEESLDPVETAEPATTTTETPKTTTTTKAPETTTTTEAPNPCALGTETEPIPIGTGCRFEWGDYIIRLSTSLFLGTETVAWPVLATYVGEEPDGDFDQEFEPTLYTDSEIIRPSLWCDGFEDATWRFDLRLRRGAERLVTACFERPDNFDGAMMLLEKGFLFDFESKWIELEVVDQ